MRVKDLIKELTEQPMDAEVYVYADHGQTTTAVHQITVHSTLEEDLGKYNSVELVAEEDREEDEVYTHIVELS